MTGAGTAGQEKVAMQAVQITSSATTCPNDEITIYAQAQGNS